MAELSAVLHSTPGGGLMFRCPGCESVHRIQVGTGPGPRWTWDGNAERPTFSPSVLVTAEYGDDFEPRRCHLFVRAGRIQFLNDCTHSLAGTTVDLPRFDEVPHHG